MTYPADLPSYTPLVANVDEAKAEQVNVLYADVTAIATELGVNPAGTATDVVTRLAQSLDGAGNLAFVDATTKTISSGAITITQNFHRIETESAAASDDLDTINGGGTQALVLFLRLLVGSHNVVIKHNTGNILTAGAVDITLDNPQDFAILVYDPTQTKWLAMGSAPNTGAATLAGDNTWTGANVFNKRIRYKYNAITTNTTLDDTYQSVNADATSGAITATLPTAVGIAGARYDITKVDSSANAVTIDGNGSETINGATTYALTAQYQSATVESNGANWIIK